MIHLHRHSEWSLLDGLGHAEAWADRAAELNMPALALTDHGNLCGALHHYNACYERGVLPIVGVEAYFKPNRQPHDASNKDYYHMVLLAMNRTGWNSLLRLTSASYREDAHYYKPIVDWDLLERYGEGLMVGTACMAGWVSKHIEASDDRAIREHMAELKRVFRGNVFMEIMPNSIPTQRIVNPVIAQIAAEQSVPLVATVDAHYACQDWSDTHAVMVSHVYEHEDDSLFLMSEQEVRDRFRVNHPYLPEGIVSEAIRNTHEVIRGFLPYHISKAPKYPRVEGGKQAARATLEAWVAESFDAKVPEGRRQEYRDRVAYELDVFERLDVLDYFVVVGDLVREMRRRRVPVGAGRGSAAASMVGYLIGITMIDPIRHGLIFERFLNPNRKSMPDIDIDFSEEGREIAKAYLREKYGEDKVADIVSFQTYGPKSALKRIGRQMKLPFAEMEALSKALEDEGDLDALYETNAAFRTWADVHPVAYQHVRRIQGEPSAQSKHASGIVVADRPIEDYMPRMRASDGALVTAWSDRHQFPIVSSYGFLKIDVLGLTQLTRVDTALALIRERHGIDLDLTNQPLPVAANPDDGDPEVFALLRRDTAGVFQAETPGISRTLRQMQVDHLNDVTAAIALYRPGPMANIPSYCARKLGHEAVSYAHEDLEEILAETYGLYVYQEQAMRIAQRIAGFTPGLAEDLRKAIGKKDAALMASLRDAFFDGARTNHYDDELIERLWAENEASQRYSFNKAHAASYAIATYTDGWLKAHYPAEFYAALLSTLRDAKARKEKTPRIVRAMHASGVRTLPPDVNRSGVHFTIDRSGAVRWALTGIKGVGVGAAAEIVAKRPFFAPTHLEQVVTKGRCNSAHRAALEAAGAMDSIGGRAGMPREERVTNERELVHYAFSDHSPERDQLVKKYIRSADEIDQYEVGEYVTVGGEILEVHERDSRRGRMAFVTIAYGTDSYRVVFFANTFSLYQDSLLVGDWCLVQGEKDDRGSIIAAAFCTMEELMEEEARAS